MGKDSQIQWTDITWNPAVGCKKVDGDCKNCYMYRDSLNGTRYDAFTVRRTKTVFNLPLKVKETKSSCWDGPPLIFTSSLTDIFLPEIDSYRGEVWDIIRKRKDLIFQMLTKRPERIAANLPEDWGDGWDNVWLGTSVGNNKAVPRINDLLKAKSKTYFVSFEPLWEKVFLAGAGIDLSKIHWAILGGESGNLTGKYKARPCQLDWMESLIDELHPNTSVFVKQLGTCLAKDLKLTDRHGGDINEFPEHLKIRNFPKAA